MDKNRFSFKCNGIKWDDGCWIPVIAPGLTMEKRKRIEECLNACEGLSDPEETVPKLLKHLSNGIQRGR